MDRKGGLKIKGTDMFLAWMPGQKQESNRLSIAFSLEDQQDAERKISHL